LVVEQGDVEEEIFRKPPDVMGTDNAMSVQFANIRRLALCIHTAKVWETKVQAISKLMEGKL
jgi:hypothetical protein